MPPISLFGHVDRNGLVHRRLAVEFGGGMDHHVGERPFDPRQPDGRHARDRTEAIALKRLLPKSGKLMLELGAGAGRNTPRYAGYERIVLLDYSRTQLEQAQARLGKSDKYIYVADTFGHRVRQ